MTNTIYFIDCCKIKIVVPTLANVLIFLVVFHDFVKFSNSKKKFTYKYKIKNICGPVKRISLITKNMFLYIERIRQLPTIRENPIQSIEIKKNCNLFLRF